MCYAFKKCFNEAPSLPGISKFHCIEPDDGYVKCRVHSNQNTCTNRMPLEVFPYDSDTDTSSIEDFVDDENELQNSDILLEEDSDCQVISSDDSDDNQKSEGNGHNTTFNCNIQEGIPD